MAAVGEPVSCLVAVLHSEMAMAERMALLHGKEIAWC